MEKKIYSFLYGISLKVNPVAPKEFELTYFDVTILNACHYKDFLPHPEFGGRFIFHSDKMSCFSLLLKSLQQVLYSSYTSLAHSFVKWLIISSFYPHNLHLLFLDVLLVFTLT